MEATKGIKPATPLPWEIHAFHQWRYEDAAYIVHACNNYGRLVEALRELVARCDGEEGVRADGSNIQTFAASAILHQLGEA